jgi:hypothetical protein
MTTPRKNPTKEQKEWMKESGYTVAQLDNFWKENVGTNPVITNLDKHGMTWRDMNVCVLKQLPTQKERDMKVLEEKKRQEEEKATEELRKQQEREYYQEHFEEVMISKIDNNERLTEKELSTLVCGYEVDSEYGDNRRWSRAVTTIVKLGERHFAIDWDEGLTEYQDNEFYNQPYEVRPEMRTKTEIYTVWLPVKENE